MMSMHIRPGSINLFPHKYNSPLLPKPPRVCVSLSTISEPLVQKHNFHPQSASQVPFALLPLEAPEKAEKILSFFIESGFSATQLEKMLKTWPGLLSVNLDKTIKPKLKILRDFGFSSDEIVEIISKDPVILRFSAHRRIIPSLSVLKGLLGSTSEVAKLLKAPWCGNYLRNDLDKLLVPNVEFLMSCGIGIDRIVWHMRHIPWFMLRPPQKFMKLVEKAEQMGADRHSKTFIYCVRVVSSMSDETWKLKVKALRDVGFSRQDILRVFGMQPQVFATSEEKIREISEIVLATGKYDASCFINNPTSLCHSIEKRYKPRIEVLKNLERKNLIRTWPKFWLLFHLTEKEFVERFVSPYYYEVGEVYMSMISPSSKRGVNSVPSPEELDLSH